MSALNNGRPTPATLKKAFAHAGKRLDETDNELNHLQKELEKLLDITEPNKKVRSDTVAVQQSLIAKGNLYMVLISRMETLAFALGSTIKRQDGTIIGTGESFLPGKGSDLVLPSHLKAGEA